MSLIYLKVFKCEYKQYITFHIQYTFIQKQTQFTNTKKIKTLSNKTIFIKGHLYSKLLFKIFFKDENILLHWVSILMIWTFYIANQRLWISILLSVLKNKKTFFFSRDKCVRQKNILTLFYLWLGYPITSSAFKLGGNQHYLRKIPIIWQLMTDSLCNSCFCFHRFLFNISITINAIVMNVHPLTWKSHFLNDPISALSFNT